jgi:hypothetical protein
VCGVFRKIKNVVWFWPNDVFVWVIGQGLNECAFAQDGFEGDAWADVVVDVVE